MTSTTDAPTAGGKKRHLLADGDEASIDSTTTTEDGQVGVNPKLDLIFF